MDIRDYALLLAIDSTDEAEVLRLLKVVGESIDGVKLGMATLLSCGTRMVSKVKEKTSGPIIADLKVADIGFKAGGNAVWSGTNSRIIELAVRSGIDYVICHSIIGTSSIQECVEVAHRLGGRIITLPFMTHRGAGLFFDQPLDVEYTTSWLEKENPGAAKSLLALGERKKREPGWRSATLSTSDLILVLGEEFGVDGYVAPANLPDVMSDLRRYTRKFALAPGVGRQGGKLEDVYRFLGPKSAAAIGHAIYDAPDPGAACKELAKARDRFAK